MKNEPELSALWPEVRARGASALRPNLAARVLSRSSELREELSTRSTLTLGLATALACLTLTLAVSAYTAHRSSDQALAQWSAFSADDGNDLDT